MQVLQREFGTFLHNTTYALQVLELLGHVNKRIKAARTMQLPLLPLVQLATGNAASRYVLK